ncbi:MAG: hypothetical protein HKN30_16855 [Sulfitobacter sp.]|nr:hypothetical protein [Sulfitobacter sp.]
MAYSEVATGVKPQRVRMYRCLGLLLLWLGFGGAAFAQTLEIEFALGPFEQQPVRQAAFAVADWQGLSRQFGLTLRYVVVRHADDEDWYEETPQAVGKARELMASAGYRDGLPTPVLIFHDRSTARLAPLVARAFSRIGLETSIQFVAPQDRDAAIARTRYNTGRTTIEIPYLFLTTSRRTPPVVELTPLPDLIAGRPEARFDPFSRRLRVRVPIENVGRGGAPKSTVAFLDRGRTLRLPDTAVPILGPGRRTVAEIELTVPESALGKILQLQTSVDPRNTVPELNVRNNLSEVVAFELPAPPPPEPERLPDLILQWQGHQFDPEARQLTVRFTLRNIGQGPSAAQWVDILSLTGGERERLARLPIGPLRAGQSVDLVQEVRLPSGIPGQTLAIAAIADVLAQVPESNERNNESEILEIPIPPEQVLVDLEVSIPRAEVQKNGRSVMVTVAVVNRNAAVSPSTLLILRGEPGGETAKVSVPSLRPGGRWTTDQTVVPKFRPAGGPMQLLAAVDPDNRVPETNENNNQTVRTVILPFPALIWGAVATVSILILSMLFPLVRARPKRRDPPRETSDEGQASAPQVLLAYVSRPDPGFQQIDPEDDSGLIIIELSLRALADPGHQEMIEEEV